MGSILFANILSGIALILGSLIDFFFIVIIASVIVSWVNADPRNVIVHSIRSITEPLYAKVRTYIPPIGMFDLSPIILLLALQLIRVVIVGTLDDWSGVIKSGVEMAMIFEKAIVHI